MYKLTMRLEQASCNVQDNSQDGLIPCENKILIGRGIKKEGLLKAKSNSLDKIDEARRGAYTTSLNEGPVDCRLQSQGCYGESTGQQEF